MSSLVPKEHPFRSYLGIAWSGAAEYGVPEAPADWPIQVAVVRADTGHYGLLRPDGDPACWTRKALVDALVRQLKATPKDPRPALIGFDFAFALPFVDEGAYFPGLADGPTTWQELHAVMRERVTPEDDFQPSPVVTDPRYADYFADDERKVEGARYKRRFRVTEGYRRLFGEQPSSVFQVGSRGLSGPGAIAGMACLAELKTQLGDAIHIWPLEGARWSEGVRAVIVEVYPRAMYRLCGCSPDAYRMPPSMMALLENAGVTRDPRLPVEAVFPSGKSICDALASAAAMYKHALNPLASAGLNAGGAVTSGSEGWILAAGSRLPALMERLFQRELDAEAAAFEKGLRGDAPSPQADHHYWLLRGILSAVASKRQTIRYEDAAGLCGLLREELLPWLKKLQGSRLGDEPDLSAVAVNDSGHPGNGWNTEWKWNKAVQARWEAERDRAFDYWCKRRSFLDGGRTSSAGQAAEKESGNEDAI